MIVKKVGAGRNRVANVLKPVLMPNTVAEAVEAIAKVRQKKLIFTGINLLRGHICCFDQKLVNMKREKMNSSMEMSKRDQI